MKRALIITFFSVALFAHLIYFSKTPPLIRAYDVQGHIDHVQFVAWTFKIPNGAQCWQCYHPPVYYTIAGAFFRLIEKIPTVPPQKALQALSLTFFLAFLGVGFKILRLCAPTAFLAPATALFFFWPVTFIHGLRIGNDPAFYLGHTLALFYLLRWQQTKESRHLWYSLLWGGLTLFIKGNAVTILATILLTFVFEEWRGLIKNKQNRELLLKQIGVISFFAAFYAVLMFMKGAPFPYRVLPQSIMVPNDLSCYLRFDWQAYLTTPFMSPFDDVTGRRYFWNYIFKSSLFGEFEFQGMWRKTLALWEGGLLLLVLGFSFFGAIISWQRRKNVALIITSVLSIGALGWYRWYIHSSSAADFRYIVPVLIPVAVFYAQAMQYFAERQWRTPLGLAYATVALFTTFGVYVVVF